MILSPPPVRRPRQVGRLLVLLAAVAVGAVAYREASRRSGDPRARIQKAAGAERGTSLAELRAVLEDALGGGAPLASLVHRLALERPERFPEARLLSDERLLRAVALLEQGECAAGRAGADPAEGRGKAAEAIRLLASEGPPPKGPGLALEAYLSRVDLSVVPYVVFRPKRPAPEGGYPLAVVLHSWWPDLDKDDFFSPIPGLLEVLEEEGWMGVWPFGRSNTDFVGPGERDVLDVVQRLYGTDRIDPGRVVLMGYSMGGTGAWTIAARRPAAFAGVVAIAGRTDYYAWQRVREESLPRYKRILLDMDFAREEAENFTALPVFSVHGELDRVVPDHQSRGLCERIRGLGGDAEFYLVPGGDHWSLGAPVTGSPRFREWLRRLKRPPHPPRFVHRFLTPTEGETYGVAAESVAEFGQPARIRGRRGPDGALDLALENVDLIRILPGAGAGGVVRLRLGRTPLEVRPGADGALLTADGEIVPEDPEVSRKRPGLSGPFRDVYSGPFLLVYGTRGTPEETTRNRAMAEREAAMWKAYAKGEAPVVADTAVLPRHLAERHAICFGTPRDHALLASVAARLPVEFRADAFRLGGREFKWGDGVGLRMVWPNPARPDRYVAVCAGAPWGEGLPANHKWDLLPDVCVYAPERNPDGTSRALAAGFFRSDWTLDGSSLEADPAPAPSPALDATGPRGP